MTSCSTAVWSDGWRRLGHKHLDSTQRYTHVTAHELRGAIKRLRWPAESGM